MASPRDHLGESTHDTHMNEENTQSVNTAIRTIVSAIVAEVMGKIEPRLAALEQKIASPASSDFATIRKMVDEVLDSALEDHVSEAIERADIEYRVESAIDDADIAGKVDIAILHADIAGQIETRIRHIDAESLRPVVRGLLNEAKVRIDL
jgi:phage baseplate assembly protein W